MLIVALSLATSVAYADDPRIVSREEFRRGVALVREGNLNDARDAFEKAYALYPHPSILLNLGIVRLRTGDYIRAEEDLSHFLVNDGGATDNEIASAREALSESRDHLGTIRLRVTPEGAHVTIDGRAVSLVQGGPTEIRTTNGLHDVKIVADDYDADEEHVMVTKDHVAERTVLMTPHAGQRADVSVPPDLPEKPLPMRSLVGWGLVGLSGATALGGILCGVRAITLADDYNNERPQDPSDKSTGIAFRTTSDILFLTAIASGGVGAYLLLTPQKNAAAVSVGPASIRVRIAF
jgi:PEGA domain-containing protein/tetratricopeptide repeat protein